MANIFSKKLLEFLKGGPFTFFELSLLLTGLEKLVEVEFLCPCRLELNALLTASIFIAPVIFTFTLLFHLVRPFKHKCRGCCAQQNLSEAERNSSDNKQNSSDAQQNPSDTHQHCPKAFLSCLIPPAIWIFTLLLDGQYVACAMTHWKGVYVFDEELKMFWCKPTEKIQNETELQDLNRKYIYNSQFAGYIWISVFSVFLIIIVGIYDCYISKKCECCPSRQLKTNIKDAEKQSNGEPNSPEMVPLQNVSSNTGPK